MIKRWTYNRSIAGGFALLLALAAGCGGGDEGDRSLSGVVQPGPETVVRGHIRWSGAKPFPAKANIRVILSDQPLADAPSVQIAEQLQREVPYEAGLGEGAPFSITVPGRLIGSERGYLVHVRMDVNGDFAVGVGDYVTGVMTPIPITRDGELTGEVVAEVEELEDCNLPGAGGYCAEGSGRTL